jgi:1,4-dihydroxy-2-naphthoate octaprenyltransferase
MTEQPSGLRAWIMGARPKTLPAAIVPVVVGTAAAADAELGSGRGISWWRFVLAMVVSLALQVGVNYANDYSDGVRGTDRDRVGPLRLVGSGVVPAAAVKRGAMVAFGVAGFAGLALAAVAGWWLVRVGVAAVGSAWLYTGGPRPYGYLGLGELFVFVFFGLVATAGSSYVQTEELDGLALACSVPVGLLATALLVTNNLRDIPTDSQAGKKTLAVRLGDRHTRALYDAMLVGAGACIVAVAIAWRPAALLGLIAVPLVLPAVRAVGAGASGRALIPVLEATGRAQLAMGAGLGLGLWLGA